MTIRKKKIKALKLLNDAPTETPKTKPEAIPAIPA